MSSSSPWSVFWTKPAPRQLALVSVSPIADTTWAKNLRDVLSSLLFFIFTVWPGSLNSSSAAWTSIKLLFPAAGENNEAKQMPPSSSYRILSGKLRVCFSSKKHKIELEKSQNADKCSNFIYLRNHVHCQYPLFMFRVESSSWILWFLGFWE